MLVSVSPSHGFPIQVTVLYLYIDIYLYVSAYNDCKLNVDVEPPLRS